MTKKTSEPTQMSLDEEIIGLATEDDAQVIDEAATEEIHGKTFSISSYGADYTVDGLVKRMKNGSFYVPPFQRSYVWNQRQASRFIESLLMGLPVPGLFVFKEVDSRHLIIDGQQRLKSLQYFYDGIFRERKERKFQLLDVSDRWMGKTYTDLETDDSQRLDDAIIHTTIFKQDQPEGDKSSIYEVFERINTGGIKLSAQEIRASVSHGAFISLLRELNNTQSWRKIYGPQSDRLKDQELILRFLALATNRDAYKRPMRRFLDRFLDDNNHLDKVKADTFKKLFTRTIDFVLVSIGEAAFRPEGQLNTAVFDSVMVGLSERLRSKVAPDKKKARGAYETLLKDSGYRDAYLKSTADEESVRSRIQAAIDAFSGM
jgi:hypothetical protein